MRVYSPVNSPEQNLAIFAENPYHGRWLIMGWSGGIAVQAYGIEGRSEPSQNRIFTAEDSIVGTEVMDPKLQKGDPNLTIYDAMRRVHSTHIVTNGNQTDRAIRHIRSGGTFEEAMNDVETRYEDDSLHTPRISGFMDMDPEAGETEFGISVVRKSPVSSEVIKEYWTERSPEIGVPTSGIGFAVHTYKGDPGAPQSFDEPPFSIPVQESAAEMMTMLMDTLDPTNRVAVAVKTITPDGFIDISIRNTSPLTPNTN